MMSQTDELDSLTFILPSNDISTNNSSNSDFTIVFPKIFVLNKQMECAITSIIFPKIKSSVNKIYVLSDIIQESFIDNKKLNVLRHFKIDNNDSQEIEFAPLIYIPVRFLEINSINIRLLNENFLSVEFEPGSVIVTLNFRNIEFI